MNKLFINGRFLTQRLTGVQRFAIEICKELAQLTTDFLIVVPVGTTTNESALVPFLIEVGNRKGTIWEQVDLYRFMKSNGATLLNLCNTAPFRYHGNIVTIHDLGVYQNQYWYSWKFAKWYKFLTPRIVKNALVILTVSKFSKSEIVQRFGVNEKSVHVVYNGVAKAVIHPRQENKEKLVVHVGTFSERKNVKMIVDCYLQSSPNEHKLVLCGNVDKNLELTTTDLNKIEGIEVRNGVKDFELAELLAKAQYVVSASSYEGFDLPILEGLANGARPILSDIPVHRELYSGVAIFFDHKNPDELTEEFRSLNKPSKAVEVNQVNSLLDRFSFEKSAEVIHQLVRSN